MRKLLIVVFGLASLALAGVQPVLAGARKCVPVNCHVYNARLARFATVIRPVRKLRMSRDPDRYGLSSSRSSRGRTEGYALLSPACPCGRGDPERQIADVEIVGSGFPLEPAPAKAGAGMNGGYAQFHPLHPFIPRKAFD